MSETTENKLEVVVYGSDECPYTKKARAWLSDWGISYRFVNVDKDSDAEALIASWNNNRAIRPTLDVDGEILVNPEREKLEAALRLHGELA
jgi:glutaredoxin